MKGKKKGTNKKAPEKKVIPETDEMEVEEEEDVEISEGDFMKMDAEDAEKLQEQALAELVKKAKRPSRKQLLKKVWDFKFRVLELVELFVKETRTPSRFLRSLLPLMQELSNPTEKGQRAALTAKIATSMKHYFLRLASNQERFEDGIEETLTTLLSLIPRVKVRALQNALKFCVQVVSSFAVKAESPALLTALSKGFKELLISMTASKSSIFVKDFFLDLARTSPKVFSKLVPTFLMRLSFDEENGAKHEAQRVGILDLLLTILHQQRSNDDLKLEQLAKKHASALGELTKAAIESHETLRSAKYRILLKYLQLYKLFLHAIPEAERLEADSEILSSIQQKHSENPSGDVFSRLERKYGEYFTTST
eukprot:TRINITY_DN3309_c0_g1_i10.p1 TRINITY_DN3309_c0_g1~~TRINITY_DN3309_c0_g1_i10.p1  ORF type:complete len:367 (-),score=104.15 TRINITY_DN3309_c0_g1_i10:448-1548(-)